MKSAGVVLEMIRWKSQQKAAGDRDLYGSAIDEVRKLLDAHDVPPAGFIDDHVSNALVQRQRLRAALEIIAHGEVDAIETARQALLTLGD